MFQMSKMFLSGAQPEAEGVLGGWEVEVGSWEVGRLGGWEVGKLGGWEVGRLGGWEVGRWGG